MKLLAAEGVTMVVVTHELGFARSIATEILFMSDGAVVEQGDPESFFTAPKQERTKQFLQRYLKEDYAI
jgi:ABC-type polar amino acid transport system ATPase subunit